MSWQATAPEAVFERFFFGGRSGVSEEGRRGRRGRRGRGKRQTTNDERKKKV
jgi:hypothetical protein